MIIFYLILLLFPLILRITILIDYSAQLELYFLLLFSILIRHTIFSINYFVHPWTYIILLNFKTLFLFLIHYLVSLFILLRLLFFIPTLYIRLLSFLIPMIFHCIIFEFIIPRYLILLTSLFESQVILFIISMYYLTIISKYYLTLINFP